MAGAGGKRKGAGRPSNKINEKPVMLGISERTRNWLCIVYPESAPENWRDIINKLRIEWVESPLHDKDLNPMWTGEEDESDPCKKAHWHIVLLFPSVKSYEQVKALTDSLNAPRPAPCQSVKGSIRYMVHKDNPEKHQYDWNDIRCHGGADLESLCGTTYAELMKIQKEIINFIRGNDITEFADLVEYCLDEGLNDWQNIICNKSTLFFRTFFSSRRHRAMNPAAKAEV